jgi:hypothetical protein
MSLMELETAVRFNLPVLVVVNDAGHGAEVHDFGPLGVDVEVARFRDCDFAAVAVAWEPPEQPSAPATTWRSRRGGWRRARDPCCSTAR